MTQRSYPGVYIEEKPSGPGPIQGVSTSNLALLGWSKKGPLNEPTFITSYPEFESKFGGFTEKSLSPTEAFAFFQNGGGAAYFVRVSHSDAVDAGSFLYKTLTAVNLVEGDGTSSTYEFTMTKTPCVAAGTYGPIGDTFAVTLVIVTNDGSGKINTFTDAGDGTFTVTTAGGAGGGSGSIDYETGEVSLTFTIPADFPGSTYAVGAFSYKTFKFDMEWPGLAGNYYRQVISGSPDYLTNATASYSRFDISVQEYDSSTETWTEVEGFSNLSFADSSDTKAVDRVVNDERLGSDNYQVTAYNWEAPVELAGTAVVDDDVAQSAAYDGAAKAFDYTIGSSVFPTTFSCQFGFKNDAGDVPIVAGTTPTALDTTFDGAFASDTQLLVPLVDDITGIANTADATVTIAFTATSASAVTVYGNEAGELREDDGGTITGDQWGTIDYTTGEFSLDTTLPATPDTLAASDVTITAFYYGPVVIDDGDGNLSLDNACGKYELSDVVAQVLDYDLGTFTLTWKIAGNPGAGPSATVYTNPPGATGQWATYYDNPSDEVTLQFFGGTDGTSIDRGDVTGASLVADMEGLYAFDKVDIMANVVIADFQTDEIVCGDLIDFCAARKDKFAIMSVPEGLTPQEAVNWKKNTLNRNTSFGAVYYPHIQILDPVTDVSQNIPGGGHIAGIYARTDENKNIAKAPAGTGDGALAWYVSLERDLTPTQVGLCNENKVNCMVMWPHTGTCVWGARTLDISGGDWPYIPMRRLFMFVEKSVFNSTHVHVFENNGPALWSKMRLQVSSFLIGLFQADYFAGTSAEEAFFVICDRTNNPQNTVDQGLVFCDVGIATNKPAEFVVFRFQQKALA